MTMKSWWRVSLLMKYKFTYVLLSFASVMQGWSWTEWTGVFLWNIFCKNNCSGKNQLLCTMKAMFQKSLNSLCADMRKIFGLRGMLSTWLRHFPLRSFLWDLTLRARGDCMFIVGHLRSRMLFLLKYLTLCFSLPVMCCTSFSQAHN